MIAGVIGLVTVGATLVALLLFGPLSRDAAPSSESRDDAGDTTSSAKEPEVNFGRLDPGPAPQFKLTDFDGDTVTLESFAGKPLVLNFWASWCMPCREEMPALERVFERFKGQVQFLGIAWEDTEAEARELAKEVDVKYPLAMDTEGIGDTFGLLGLPTTYLIDADSQIVEAHFGPLTEHDLTEMLEEFFPDLR